MREDGPQTPECGPGRVGVGERRAEADPQGGPEPATARTMLRDLRLRDESFPPGLFGDHRWQALLTLYGAKAEDREVRLLDLLNELGAPFTTGRRIVDEFEGFGLFTIRPGDYATARKLVSVTPAGLDQIEAHFERRAGETGSRSKWGRVVTMALPRHWGRYR